MADDTLKRAADMLSSMKGKKEEDSQKLEQERRDLITQVGDSIVQGILPALEQVVEASRINEEAIVDAITNIRIENVIPDISVPEVNVPQARVNVNVPPIRVPDIIMPKEMETRGWLSVMGYDKSMLSDPLPVQLRDASGKPIDLSSIGGTSIISGGGGGGKQDYFTIKGFSQSAFAELMNADGEVRVAGTFTAAAAASTYVIAGNAEGIPYNSANPFPVTITSGGSATSASNIVDSSGVAYSGSNPVPVVITSGASATSASNIVDSSGVAYSGSNPVPVTGTIVVSSVTATTAQAIVDSTGVQYSGSNPVPVSGAVTNTGTFAVQATVAAGATNIAKEEDAASADADVGVPSMAVRKATPANTSGADGDYEMLQMSAGRLWTSATVDAALPAGTNAIGKLAANSGVTIGAVEVASAQTLATVTTVTTLTGGGVAHDGADSGNPVKVGARAALTLSDDTMVANADRTDLVSDADAALITRAQFPLGDLISERVSNTDGASTAFTNFGAVASTRSVITAIHVFRTDAGTTPIYVDFRDGTAGSVLYSMVIPPNGGAILPAGATPYFRTSAYTALAYDVSAATTTVYISVSGFKSKV